ncbi:MAG: hypothetical protein KDI35_13140, partial [Gammaproteobacteria bacterium]|nr:hypothetical protein [Gammaproteobacteria bacterium]
SGQAGLIEYFRCASNFAFSFFRIMAGFVIIKMPAFAAGLSMCAISMMKEGLPLFHIIIDFML